MLMLPLYPIRVYETIFEEGKYKIIQTPRNRYVLDYIDRSEPDYLERRFALSKEYLPYRLYPLYHGYDTVKSLINNRKKHKTYIDRKGNILKWEPKTYHKVTSYKIDHKWIPNTIPRLCFCIPGSCEVFDIAAPNFVVNYARIIEVGNRRILYDVSEEEHPDTRVRL